MSVDAWVVLTAVILLAGLNWWSRVNGDGRLEEWTKPMVTVLVILLALVLNASGAATAWCVVALVLCLVGDVALLPRVDRFVVGLGAFLFGHLAFIGMFVSLGLDRWALAVPALVAVVLLGATIGRRIVVGAAPRSLDVPVRAYLAVISAMAVIGWATGRTWIMIGSVAFVASDSVLGWRQFVHARAWMPVTIMATYHLALVALTLGLIG